MSSYHAAIAQTCGGKHMEDLSPDALHTQVQGFYATLGTSERGLFDKAVRKSCGTSPSTDCYNTAAMQAAMQNGTMQPLVDRVCQSR